MLNSQQYFNSPAKLKKILFLNFFLFNIIVFVLIELSKKCCFFNKESSFVQIIASMSYLKSKIICGDFPPFIVLHLAFTSEFSIRNDKK